MSQLLTMFSSFYLEFLSKDCVDNQQIGMSLCSISELNRGDSIFSNILVLELQNWITAL